MADALATQKTVIVLGMHRSGNSLIGGILHLLGVDLGKRLLAGNQFNPKGFFEDIDFLQLNEKILKHCDGDWDNPPDRDAILRCTLFGTEIQRLLRGRQGLWGWRDPRTTLTIELYLPFLVNPHFVVCWRNPNEIVKSLKEWMNFDELKTLKLTNRYHQRIVDLFEGHPTLPRLMIAFEDLTADPITEVRRLSHFLDIPVTEEQMKHINELILPKHQIREQRARIQREREQQLERTLVKLQQQLASVSGELKSVQNSTSWKMTAWLRWGKRKGMLAANKIVKIFTNVFATPKKISAKHTQPSRKRPTLGDDLN